MSVLVTDNFDRADGALGSNWTTGFGSGGQIGSHQAQAAGLGFQMAFWNADSFLNNQYAQCIEGGATVNYVAPVVRANATSAGNGYAGYFKDSQPYKLVNGSWTTIGSYSDTTIATGDTIKITAVGTTITVTVNGAERFSGTDAALASGSAGMAWYDTSSRIDDWEGGDIVPAFLLVRN